MCWLFRHLNKSIYHRFRMMSNTVLFDDSIRLICALLDAGLTGFEDLQSSQESLGIKEESMVQGFKEGKSIHAHLCTVHRRTEEMASMRTATDWSTCCII